MHFVNANTSSYMNSVGQPTQPVQIRVQHMPVSASLNTLPPAFDGAAFASASQSPMFAVPFRAPIQKSNGPLVGSSNNLSVREAATNAKERYRGFREALEAEKLPYEPELVTEGDYRIESGFRAGHALLSQRPDGIYCANHLMTIGLLKAAGEIGLTCPEDFGLVSFDDYPWLGVFRPRLTTVELPKHQLGSEAAELLIRRIAGDTSAPVLRKLQPELRIRESCGFGLFVSGAQRDPNVPDATPTS